MAETPGADYLAQRGELRAARAANERAVALAVAVYGPDDPEVAISLGNLGVLLRQFGELEAARAAQERALAIRHARGLGDW